MGILSLAEPGISPVSLLAERIKPAEARKVALIHTCSGDSGRFLQKVAILVILDDSSRKCHS